MRRFRVHDRAGRHARYGAVAAAVILLLASGCGEGAPAQTPLLQVETQEPATTTVVPPTDTLEAPAHTPVPPTHTAAPTPTRTSAPTTAPTDVPVTPTPDTEPEGLAFADSGQLLGAGRSWDVALGDLDGDGDLDALVANDGQRGGGNVAWLNSGQGAFTASEPQMGNGSNLSLGDLDGDGDLDAIITHWAEATKIWLNQGGAQGGTAGIFIDSAQTMGRGHFGLALGDVDNDGDLDAFIGKDGIDAVWLNDGNGAFSNSGQQLGAGLTAAVALADLDRDGDLDALAGGWGEAAKVWLNDGVGNLVDSGQELSAAHRHIHDIATGDLDGDGDLDAFMAMADGGPNEVWLNIGTAEFQRKEPGLESPLAHGVALADVDGDGDLDALTAHGAMGAGSGGKVWLNNGRGDLADSGLQLGNVFNSAVALGDLDGDGDLDAFLTHTNWQENSGGLANRVWLNETPGVTASGSSTPASVSFNLLRDVPYAPDDRRQKLDLYLPELEGPLPVLLALPGGSGGEGNLGFFARHFAGKGYAVVATDRRNGEYPEGEQDAFCALAWVHANGGAYGLDPERITAVGFSRGGALAGLLGAVDDAPGGDVITPFMESCPYALPDEGRTQSVISVAGIADFVTHVQRHPDGAANYPGYFGGDADQVPEVWAEASPVPWVDGSEPPFLLIHGETDQTVYPEQSVRFAQALEDAGASVTLELVPVLSHLSIANSPRVFEVMEGFLTSLAEQGTDAPEHREGMIVFYSQRDGNAEIYAMHPDGSGVQRLTDHPAADICPAWSPDGTRIVFLSDRDDPDSGSCSPHCRYQAYLMAFSEGTGSGGSEPRRLTDIPSGVSHPAWSPGSAPGRGLVSFDADMDGDGKGEIYVVQVEAALAGTGEGAPQALTSGEADDRWADWSPDGSHIAFSSDRDGDYEIYVMAVSVGTGTAGSEPQQITLNEDNDYFPAWSPRGVAESGQIAFMSRRGGRTNVFVVGLDGSPEVQLTERGRVNEDPAWSPDGTAIVFQSDRDGNFEIYSMAADGSGQARLTNDRAGDYWPSWGAPVVAVAPEAAESAERTAVEITFIGNEGFLIASGDVKILIDGLLGTVDGLVSATTARNARYARPPFDDVDLVLVTHSHSDHFDPVATGTHLESNAGAILVSTLDVVNRLQARYAGFDAFQDRVAAIDLGRGESTQLVAGGVDLEMIDVPHGDTPNLGFLITVGGHKLLHLGDPDVDPTTASNLEPYDLSSKKIDVLLIPYPFLSDESLRTVITETIQPAHTIPMHYTPRQAVVTATGFQDSFPDAVVFEEEMQSWTLDGSE